MHSCSESVWSRRHVYAEFSMVMDCGLGAHAFGALPTLHRLVTGSLEDGRRAAISTSIEAQHQAQQRTQQASGRSLGEGKLEKWSARISRVFNKLYKSNNFNSQSFCDQSTNSFFLKLGFSMIFWKGSNSGFQVGPKHARNWCHRGDVNVPVLSCTLVASFPRGSTATGVRATT